MSNPFDRELYSLLANLLSYPASDYTERVCFAYDRFDSTKARAAIGQFVQVMTQKSQGECEELYTQTFDLSPPCSPTVSSHLFGEESFKRAGLMAQLREDYDRIGLDPGTELPDHIATMLRYMEIAPEDIRGDIDLHVLRPSLRKMSEILARIHNPYAHLLEAATTVLRAEFGREPAHA